MEFLVLKSISPTVLQNLFLQQLLLHTASISFLCSHKLATSHCFLAPFTYGSLPLHCAPRSAINTTLLDLPHPVPEPFATFVLRNTPLKLQHLGISENDFQKNNKETEILFSGKMQVSENSSKSLENRVGK